MHHIRIFISIGMTALKEEGVLWHSSLLHYRQRTLSYQGVTKTIEPLAVESTFGGNA